MIINSFRPMVVVFTLALYCQQTASSLASELRVAASIPPIHSLVAGVMQGAGEPDLIVEANQSPHDFSLKPSQAVNLQNTNLIFWVGPGLEGFLEKSLKSIAANARSVSLIETAGLHHIDLAKNHDEHEEEDHEGHHHGEHDPHIWLDPENAVKIIERVAMELGKLDPSNADVYLENAKVMKNRASALTSSIKSQTAQLGAAKYFVFHDAYRHFEHQFDIKSSGVIRSGLQHTFSASRIKLLQQRLLAERVTCVFSEPQFDPKVIATLSEGSSVKIEELDPLGQKLKLGPDLYFEMMQNLTQSLADCLK